MTSTPERASVVLIDEVLTTRAVSTGTDLSNILSEGMIFVIAGMVVRSTSYVAGRFKRSTRCNNAAMHKC